MRRIFSFFPQSAFLQNSLIVFVGTMLVSILNYVFHLMIGRSVDAQTYGEIESLISLLSIISVPAATITLIATKYAANMRAEQNIKGTQRLAHYLHRKVLLYALPFFVVILLLTPLVRDFLKLESSIPILFLWGIMFLSFLSAVTSGLLVGWQKFFSLNLAGVISTLLRLAVAFFAIRIGFAVSGVMGSYAVALVLGYLISLYFLHELFKKSSLVQSATPPIEFSSVKNYVLPALYGTLAMAIFGNADMIFAKHHLDGVTSGEYGALTVVAKTILLASGVLSTVLFAMAAEESHKRVQSLRTLVLATSVTLGLSGGAVLLFFLFPEFVMTLFFGEKYVSVSSLLGWFGVAAAIYSLGNLLLQYLLSINEIRGAVVFLALSGLEIAALFLWGGQIYAIIALTIIAQILAVLLGIFYIWKRKRHE